MSKLHYSQARISVQLAEAELKEHLVRYLHPDYPAYVQLRIVVENDKKEDHLEMVLFDDDNKGFVNMYSEGLYIKQLKEHLLINYIRYIAAKGKI